MLIKFTYFLHPKFNVFFFLVKCLKYEVHERYAVNKPAKDNNNNKMYSTCHVKHINDISLIIFKSFKLLFMGLQTSCSKERWHRTIPNIMWIKSYPQIHDFNQLDVGDFDYSTRPCCHLLEDSFKFRVIVFRLQKS